MMHYGGAGWPGWIWMGFSSPWWCGLQPGGGDRAAPNEEYQRIRRELG